MATEELNPELMEPYKACRLIPLDKNPGVRPIGIGEVMRGTIGRTITKCLKNELMSLEFKLSINSAWDKNVALNMRSTR